MSFKPVASVWKLRWGPPHCVQARGFADAAVRGAGAALRGACIAALLARPNAGAANAIVRNVRRSIGVPFQEGGV